MLARAPAAGAAAPVALMVRGQHGGRKCPFQKKFLVYPLHLNLFTSLTSANAVHLYQKDGFGSFLKQVLRVDEYLADW